MGQVMLSGVAPKMTVPSTDIKAGDLAIGSVIKLMENGVSADYLVINQGIPGSSSVYDSSCDGTWLLRKDLYTLQKWHSSDSNSYSSSTIHSYLNSTFLNIFDSNIKSLIKQVKIPYRSGSGIDTTVTSGANGLSASIFLLSATEVGISVDTIPSNEGAVVSQFSGCNAVGIDARRIAYFSGTAKQWWLRSPKCYSSSGSSNAMYVSDGGNFDGYNCTYSIGVRPALVLNNTAIFDKKTLTFRGVA